MRRTAGDWIADISLVLFAACFAVLTADAVLAGKDPLPPDALFADQAVGALACAALLLRRRLPVALAVALLLAGKTSHFVTGATIVALFTVAVSRPLRATAWVAALALAPLPYVLATSPDLDDPGTSSALTYFALVGAAIGWGCCVRSRRQLVASLRERADRAHEEARRLVREDIAREMHDVLAHRLSLLSVHAGALHYNADASPEQVRRTAGVIRDSAHDALEDLRGIIGVLRGAPASGARPQPVLADVARLAEESREAGTEVTLVQRLGAEPPADGEDGDSRGTGAPPPAVGRTAFRIVQEALTNARKHAPGAPVTVTLSGGPGEGLTVLVRNALPGRRTGPAAVLAPDRTGDPVPGAGQGLVGLAERAELAGGSLHYGPAGSEFRVDAWLPWSAESTRPEPIPAAPAAH